MSHKVEGKFVLSRVDPIAISFLSDLPHESQNFCRQFPISDELSNRTWNDSNYDNWTRFKINLYLLRWDDNLINCTHISRVPREEEEKKKKKKEKRQRCSRLLEREVVFNWFRGKFNLQALTEDWNSKIHPHFNPRPTRINRVRVGTWLIRVNEKRRYLFFSSSFTQKYATRRNFERLVSRVLQLRSKSNYARISFQAAIDQKYSDISVVYRRKNDRVSKTMCRGKIRERKKKKEEVSWKYFKF